jgi:hypothetical protein
VVANALRCRKIHLQLAFGREGGGVLFGTWVVVSASSPAKSVGVDW